MKWLALHLPLIVGAGLVVAFSTDLPVLRPLKREELFGYWLVVVVPVAALLLGVQLVIWTSLVTRGRKIPASRPGRGA